MNARKLTATTLASLCVPIGLLALTASAEAAVTHDYLSQITEVPASSGAAFTGPLYGVHSMTVDSGDLYTVEGNAEISRLNKFDGASGAFIEQFPHVASLQYLDQGVAVAHASGVVYVGGDEFVAGVPEGAVGVLSATGSLQAIWKGADTPSGEFNCFECGPGGYGDVAVDNSTSLADPAAGDVYVQSPEQRVIDVFKPSIGGGETYVTQLTGSEPGVTFGTLNGIAVDQSNGDVLVADGEGVDVFEPTVLNEYTLVRRIATTPGGALENVRGVSVDGGTGDIYVLADEQGVGPAGEEVELGLVDEYSSAGVYLGHLTQTPGGALEGVTALAVDPGTHRLYIAARARQQGVVDIFGPDVVIPDVTSEPVSSLKAQSATLNGTVNPDNAGAATCQFDYGTSTSLGEVAPCPAPLANGTSPVGVQVSLSGLQPDTTYHYRLQASNASGTNPGEAFQDQEFTTPGPGVHEQGASGVTATSATLNAKIDPHGTLTSYYFQYGADTSYGSVVPSLSGVALGAGEGDLSASVHLQGLTAATTYHYRVVLIAEANGEAITVYGPDETFATQTPGAEVTQPDGRAWEMVSPPDKQGAAINAIGVEQGSDVQASAAGDGITYTATSSFVANPAGNRSIEAIQVISNREAPADWATNDITTAHNEGASRVAIGAAAEYKLFSSDLTLGLVEPAGDTPLSPPLSPGEVQEKTVYIRTASGGYEALVTKANTPTGTVFGGTGELAGGVSFVGASSDLRHVVLEGRVPLTNTPLPSGAQSLLYEWSEDQLRLVSVLPGGEASSGELGERDVSVKNAISSDGSRVVFEGGGDLNLRDMNKGETIAVDRAPGAPETPPPGNSQSHYQTASTDGSRVFFTSQQRLTSDSTAQFMKRDLYEFELSSGPGERLAGKLTDLTVDSSPGAAARVQGVIGASDDGSAVFFVAQGVLGDGAGHGAENGGHNLYVERYDSSTRSWAPPTFIAALAPGDYPTWGSQANNIEGSNGSGELDVMTARVSPNGRYLAFMSERSLTGYENRDASGDVPDEEVYLYDAGSGRLVCTSCNPSGARPAGLHRGQGYEESLIDFSGIWNDRWLAGSIPAWDKNTSSVGLYQSRYLSNSGRLFFNSSDALVPADANGKEDVYEYEPVGMGSCQPPGYGESASDVYSAGVGGCIALISAGTSSEESAFMDASEDGGDVFFLTLSRLTSADLDTNLDLYDDHVCSSSEPCVREPASPLPPCATGDACKAAPTPQPAIFGAPASATFSGAGNVVSSVAAPVKKTTKELTRAQKLVRALKVCRKESKRNRAGCERRARKSYGARKSRSRKKSLSARARR